MGCKSYMNPQRATRLWRERQCSSYSLSLICETGLRMFLLFLFWNADDNRSIIQRSNGQRPLEIEEFQGILLTTSPGGVVRTSSDVSPCMHEPIAITFLGPTFSFAKKDAPTSLDDLDTASSKLLVSSHLLLTVQPLKLVIAPQQTSMLTRFPAGFLAVA